MKLINAVQRGDVCRMIYNLNFEDRMKTKWFTLNQFIYKRENLLKYLIVLPSSNLIRSSFSNSLKRRTKSTADAIGGYRTKIISCNYQGIHSLSVISIEFL